MLTEWRSRCYKQILSWTNTSYVIAPLKRSYRVARNFRGSLFLRIGDFCVLRELIWLSGTHWFFLQELIFAILRKYPVLSIDNIFVFFDYVQWEYIFQTNSLYTVLFLNEADKFWLNRHVFLVLNFCVANLS